MWRLHRERNLTIIPSFLLSGRYYHERNWGQTWEILQHAPNKASLVLTCPPVAAVPIWRPAAKHAASASHVSFVPVVSCFLEAKEHNWYCKLCAEWAYTTLWTCFSCPLHPPFSRAMSLVGIIGFKCQFCGWSSGVWQSTVLIPFHGSDHAQVSEINPTVWGGHSTPPACQQCQRYWLVKGLWV